MSYSKSDADVGSMAVHKMQRLVKTRVCACVGTHVPYMWCYDDERNKEHSIRIT